MEEGKRIESAALIAKGKVSLLLEKGISQKHDLGLAGNKKEPSVDEEQLMLVGSTFFNANFFSLFVCMLTGLLSLMFVPGIVTILHFTGRSDTPTLAFRSKHSTYRTRSFADVRSRQNILQETEIGSDMITLSLS